MYAKQKAAHEALSATFPAETIAKWDAEVQAWQENPAQAPDPYEEQRTSKLLMNHPAAYRRTDPLLHSRHAQINAPPDRR